MRSQVIFTRSRAHLLVAVIVAVVIVGVTTGLAVAYPRYNDGCQICHGEFTGGTSPQGTVFPNNNKHTMHRSSQNMNTECDLCHSAGDGNNPFIGMSDGTDINPGVGCTGCHGRDYGGALGHSGVGLRAHHFINNITVCEGCHPNDPPPLPEDVLPIYYGTADTNVDEPCNESGLENWSIGDTQGSDNDGDNDYDQADSDCGCPTDLDGSGATDATDLATVLGAWGPNPGSPADFDGNGVVDATDLATLLGGWGPC